MFLDFVNKQGLWEITKTTPHPSNPDATLYEYWPFKQNKDGSFVDPRQHKGSEPHLKSVIKGLASSSAEWQASMTLGFDEAIRALSINPQKPLIQITVKGLVMEGYLSEGVVKTLWPMV